MDGPFKNEYIASCLLMHRVRADEWNDRKNLLVLPDEYMM